MAATPTFSDTFGNLSLWNGSSGTWNTNFWYNPLNGNGGSLPSNGEQEWYINSNDPSTNSIVPWTVQNGILTITGSAAPSSIQSLINGYQYVSGELNSYHSFSQLYGFFEARMQLPAGQGLWPAFWMIPENGSWPPEIDIMEMLGNDPSTYYTSVHSGTASAEVSAGQADKVADTSKAYHEFAVDWTPTTLTYYFDNKPVYSTPTPSDMNVPMYMELNLAMGGGWPGNINSTTPLPAQMRVANVEAYASNPNPIGTSTTFTANNTAGQVLIGVPGNNIFNAGTNSVIMTGDGLTNTYVWNATPTAAAQITDFDPGTDIINLSGLLRSGGYVGSNPLSDGTVTLSSDGHGGTDIIYDHNGAQTGIVELDNVDPTQLSSSDFLFNDSGAGTGSSGGTGSTGISSDNTLQGDGTHYQILQATTPSDIFIAGQGSPWMTQDGGSNTFVFKTFPTDVSSAQITNFNPATDKVDLSGLLKSVGYNGTNPFSDGTLALVAAGGGTSVEYTGTGAGFRTIVGLQNVAPSSLNINSDFVLSPSGNTLQGNGTHYQVMHATTTSDIFIAGQGSPLMTEDGGSNVFVFNTFPSDHSSAQITNFNPAADAVDLSGLLQSIGYSGSNPFADGTLALVAAGSDTNLEYTGTAAGFRTIVGLQNITPSALSVSANFVLSPSSNTLQGNGTHYQVMHATTTSDIFIAGQGSPLMTEDGGSNVFVFNVFPTDHSSAQITNFNPATDKVDLSGLLQSIGYEGTNPFADGTLTLAGVGGDTNVEYTGTSAPFRAIVGLQNVTPSSLNISTDFVFSTSVASASSSGGQTLTADGTLGQILTATTPNDTFIAGQNSVVMTEDGGANSFVYSALPYNSGHITNFNPASDTISVAAMLHTVGYAGSNPFSDGTLSLTSDGNGGTNLYYNPPGAGSNGVWPIKVVDIDHVAASSISTAKDFVVS